MAQHRLFGEEAECGDEANHHPAGGVRAVTGDVIANLPRIPFDVTAEDVSAQREGRSAIRRAITSSPSALSPAFSDAIRSAIAVPNSEICARLRLVSATSLSMYSPTERPVITLSLSVRFPAREAIQLSCGLPDLG